VLVLIDGQAVCATGDQETAQELWSGTKSIAALLAAIAVDDGLLTLDELASNTLIEWANDPLRKQIRIADLLKMTSGIPSQVGMPPAYAQSLEIPLRGAPGEQFLYGPAPYQVFGEVLRRKLAQLPMPTTIEAYANSRLFGPLDITDYRWRSGRDGNPLMPQGIAMRADDLAKIGLLIAAEGRHNGADIIQRDTLRALFVGSDANGAYGVGWWLPQTTISRDRITATFDLARNNETVPTDLVAAAGAGGQRLYIVPSRHLVVVRQASLDLSSLRGDQTGAVERPVGWSDTAFMSLILDEN
jgi:CubicO group peptidase (beta-lactamase class C family)